ncbi:hypothetical protein [Microbacterium hydrocarbonoxydans]|uniref:hypothetical protein n=1 Tax=Microbacterium hydrocarbonoxydans TaxID=273678 RepID=UPI0007BC35A8|nr:hypothetical protein [Microbacterium hydrocarbonoxydans]GAT73871.1 hypothetical protein MHM582_2366 [Microbacterium sp. HM58-2]
MRRVAAACLVAAAAVLGSAGPATAAPTTEVVQGEVLRLVSVADWDAASSLLPGQPVRWDIAVSADAPDPGVIGIGISASGGAPLVLDAWLCMQAWEGGDCPSGATVLRSGWEVPRDGAEVPLAQISDTEVAHLRLSVALAAEEDGRTEVRVHATGAGESAVVGPGGGLAATGMPSPALPWVLGGGSLIAGILLLLLRSRREES